jgi:hypothetical protein
MALTDAKIRAAKPDEKPANCDSGNMFLLFIPWFPYCASAIASLERKTLALVYPTSHCQRPERSG